MSVSLVVFRLLLIALVELMIVPSWKHVFVLIFVLYTVILVFS